MLMRKNKENLEFDTNLYKPEDQMTVFGVVGDDLFPVVKLVERKNMYNKGLEYGFKPLVDMTSIVTSMCNLLNGLNDVGKLSEERYESVMSCYEPFIDIRMSWDTFVSRYNTAVSNEGWL